MHELMSKESPAHEYTNGFGLVLIAIAVVMFFVAVLVDGYFLKFAVFDFLAGAVIYVLSKAVRALEKQIGGLFFTGLVVIGTTGMVIYGSLRLTMP